MLLKLLLFSLNPFFLLIGSFLLLCLCLFLLSLNTLPFILSSLYLVFCLFRLRGPFLFIFSCLLFLIRDFLRLICLLLLSLRFLSILLGLILIRYRLLLDHFSVLVSLDLISILLNWVLGGVRFARDICLRGRFVRHDFCRFGGYGILGSLLGRLEFNICRLLHRFWGALRGCRSIAIVALVLSLWLLGFVRLNQFRNSYTLHSLRLCLLGRVLFCHGGRVGDFRFNGVGDGTAGARLARYSLISLLHIRRDFIDEAVKAVCRAFWLWQRLVLGAQILYPNV